MKTYNFPFTAIVDNDDIKLGLIVNAIDPKIGGLLITGPKGIAKSTMVRSLISVLPEVLAVKGCRFHCDPAGSLCDECIEREKHGRLEIENLKIKIINLPNSSTLDRVVGSLDIAGAINGKAVLREGLLGEANRGILYIDEINLLDDSIVDSILDSAASGINIVEREGVSYVHPAAFILIGTMNPEEGELRPQLLDRFGISVEGKMPESVAKLIEISNRVEAFDSNTEEFISQYIDSDREILDRIISARKILHHVIISRKYLEFIGDTVLKNSLSNRAMISTVKTARAIAAYNQRMEVNSDDVRKALEFALNHRLKEKGKPKPDYNMENQLNKNNSENNGQEDTNNNDEGLDRDNGLKNKDNNPGLNDSSNKESKDKQDVRNIELKMKEKPVGNRSGKSGLFKEHRYIGTKIGSYFNMRASLINTWTSGYTKINSKTIVMNDAYARGSIPFIIAIDASRSMNFYSRLEIAREVSDMLLKKLYIMRSKVALLSFSGNDASVLMNFTRNFGELESMINSIKSNGKTPLYSGLESIYKLSAYSKQKTISLLISDGRGNVFKGNPQSDLVFISKKISKASKLYIIDRGENRFLPTYNDIIAKYAGAKIINNIKDIALN
ncbi:MAG: VWA domain-containing protein [Ferroplasma sp.]